MTIHEFKQEHLKCSLQITRPYSHNINPDDSKVWVYCEHHGKGILSNIPEGKFCRLHLECVGKGSCPLDYACND